ncbi:GtrA family protein [Terrabacter sp. 2YAF2]|uniref:GtrA family protein n=1 Tax=Terrabacter sp. 2YAF2 TaxID=3233026 RepID=UPI003F99DBF7
MTVKAVEAIGDRAVWQHVTSADFARGVFCDHRVAFILVGGLNTAFGLACFAAFEAMLDHITGYMVVLLMAHITSVLFAFTMHRKFVFRVTGNVFEDLWRFESVNLTSLGVNALLLPFCVEAIGLPVVGAQALVTCIIAVISWLGHSRFSFNRVAVNP